MRRIVSAMLILAAFAPPVFGAEIAYTDLDLDSCEMLKRYEETGGFDARCEGLDGYPVFVSEGDARMSVSFGGPRQLFGTFSPFNSIGETVEWRLADGRPQAAIVRFHLSAGADSDRKADVLLVSKVGDSNAPGCPMAAIDVTGTEQANGVARGVAALASRFDCKNPPIIIGGQDGLARTFNSAVPEGR